MVRSTREIDRQWATAIPPRDWKEELRTAIRDPLVLAERLGLSHDWIASRLPKASSFPLFVTESFLSRIRPGDIDDPLLRQVLPTAEEDEIHPDDSVDPVGDLDSKVAAGLLHKYHGRALLVTTGACAVHCRYCFRRHFPYSEGPKSRIAWQPAIDYLYSDQSISEVILSGGDPLTLTDEKLDWLVESLAEIPHVRRLRWHTRVPVFLPQRITSEAIRFLANPRFVNIMVLHVNHANEIDASVASAAQALRREGIQLLNQAVLLRGVNDSLDALTALSERLLEAGILPYYLHQLDPVRGASHFHVKESDGLKLIDALRGALPGYAVPRYVCESPGKPSKTWLVG